MNRTFMLTAAALAAGAALVAVAAPSMAARRKTDLREENRVRVN